MRAITTRRCAGIAIAGAVMFGGCATPGPILPPNPPPDQSIPGVQPTVQDWFAAREPIVLALDDAIVEVNQQLEQPPPAAAGACAKLADAAARLLAAPAPPVSELAEPAIAGLASYARAAESCAAGDYGAAAQQIADGATLRADASLVLDMLLMGRHPDHQS